MNVKEFAEKHGIIEDDLTHDEYYTRVVDALGYEDVLKYIPFSLVEVAKAIKKDEHLNNLSLDKWDEMSGIGLEYNKVCSCKSPYHNHKGLYHVYRKHGITCFSQCDGVCILKRCAKMALEREGIQA